LESLSIASIGTYVCIFEWPTIEQFTVEIGTTKINEYLSYWKFEEDWKYCINFLEGVSDSACDFYQYEVRKSYKNHQVITRNDQFQAIFSIPCKQYPIPQATASVYFTFELSRVRPKHCLVDVFIYNITVVDKINLLLLSGVLLF
jgi:A-kinase anchor protein 14